MTKKSSYNKTLNQGFSGELSVIEKLKTLNIDAVITDIPQNVEFDLDCIFNNIRFTIEVKHDIFSRISGNFAIEFYNSKSCKNSGITATKANFWCHIVKDEIFIIKTSDLKKFIVKNEPKKILYDVGDDNACIYLYGNEFLETEFLNLSKSTKEESIGYIIKCLKE